MNGMLIAVLAQAMLLFGATAGFNQPSSVASSDYSSRVSTETIQKSLYLKPGGLILLDTEFGNVSIEEYSGKEVKVELKLQGTPESISGFHFTHNYFLNQLTLKGWYDKSEGKGDPSLRQVEFVVMVPRGMPYAVRAKTKQGTIDANVSGNLTGLDLMSDMGSVRIRMPADLSADIDVATSGVGGVRVTPVKLFDELCPSCEIFKSDRLKVRMNGGGSAISAYSGIGNVYFEIVSGPGEKRS